LKDLELHNSLSGNTSRSLLPNVVVLPLRRCTALQARRKLVEGLPPHHVVPHHDNHTELAATAATMTAESGADASSSASSTSSSSSAYGSWRAFQPVSAEYAERHLHLAQAPNFELPVHTLLAPLPQSSHAESDVKEDDETERQDSHLAVQDQTSEGAEPQVKGPN